MSDFSAAVQCGGDSAKSVFALVQKQIGKLERATAALGFGDGVVNKTGAPPPTGLPEAILPPKRGKSPGKEYSCASAASIERARRRCSIPADVSPRATGEFSQSDETARV